MSPVTFLSNAAAQMLHTVNIQEEAGGGVSQAQQSLSDKHRAVLTASCPV